MNEPKPVYSASTLTIRRNLLYYILIKCFRQKLKSRLRAKLTTRTIKSGFFQSWKIVVGQDVVRPKVTNFQDVAKIIHRLF